jgi:hypothetical protein
MRFPYFALIWVGYITLAGISLFQETSSFVLVLFTLAALAATVVVMQSIKPETQSRASAYHDDDEKAKRSPDTSLNSSLLALLDDNDREVLRQQIMQRLMDNMDQRSDGELNTLESLLAEQDPSTKRLRR